MSPAAEVNGMPSLRKRLELLVEQLPAECDALSKRLERPRFVHAVIILPVPSDGQIGNDGILKASLKKQLDSADLAPKRKSIKVELSSTVSSIKEDDAEEEVDFLAEAVRVLREAREKLDDKLRSMGCSLTETNNSNVWTTQQEVRRNDVVEAVPQKSPNLAPLSVDTNKSRQSHQNQAVRLLSPGGISFPSEMRKYRFAAIVNS